MGLGGDGSWEKVRLQGGYSHAFIPLASLLCSRTPPTVRGIRACASLPCMTLSCQHPLRLGALLSQLVVVEAEEVEDRQPPGSKGKRREQRASRRRRRAGKGIQAGHIEVAKEA